MAFCRLPTRGYKITQTQNYTNTKLHKYRITQIQSYTNTPEEKVRLFVGGQPWKFHWNTAQPFKHYLWTIINSLSHKSKRSFWGWPAGLYRYMFLCLVLNNFFYQEHKILYISMLVYPSHSQIYCTTNFIFCLR